MKVFFSGFFQRRIYADAAAATPVHPKVTRRITEMLAVYGNPGGLHQEARKAKSELEKARAEIAAAISAHPDEIIFTASGTESNNLALLGALKPLLRLSAPAGERGRVHAVTTAIEHSSVLEPLRHLKKYGLELTELPVDGRGLVSMKEFRASLRTDTALVSVQLVNSEIGTIEPLRELGKEIRHARKERAAAGNKLPLYFHTDLCQAALYLPLNVEKLGVDMATLDGQKMLGPKGVGALYLRRGSSIEPVLFGGKQENSLRSGTENVLLCSAFAEALTMAQRSAEARAGRTSEVRNFLFEEIKRLIPDVHLNGAFEHRVANNLNISIPGLEGEVAAIALDAMGVAVSTRSACAAKDDGPSHVITALGVDAQRAREAIRISLLPNVTKKEATRIAEALAAALKLYGRKNSYQKMQENPPRH